MAMLTVGELAEWLVLFDQSQEIEFMVEFPDGRAVPIKIDYISHDELETDILSDGNGNISITIRLPETDRATDFG